MKTASICNVRSLHKDKKTYNALICLIFAFCLAVYSRNVTADPGEDPVTLHCVISGFDNNIPEMDYEWSKNNAVIPFVDDKYETVVDGDSPGWYKLKIKSPGQLTHK